MHELLVATDRLGRRVGQKAAQQPGGAAVIRNNGRDYRYNSTISIAITSEAPAAF